MKETFVSELEWLINKYSKENESNTPDYLLAGFVGRCLQAYTDTVNQRDKWFSAPHKKED